MFPALHHWLWINDNQMFAISPCSIPGTDLGLLFIIDYDKAELCLRYPQNYFRFFTTVRIALEWLISTLRVR